MSWREDSTHYAELQRKHFALGERFYRLGDRTNAELEFQRTIELAPKTDVAAMAQQYLSMIRGTGMGLSGEQVQPDAQ
jgi:hypothetical protein